MNAALYLNHPYGVPVIGWRHEMEALDKPQLTEFYRRHYAPNNAILVVAGDVTPDEVRTLAERHYGAIPANPAVTRQARPQEPPHRAARRLVQADPRVAQPYVMRMFQVPERDPGNQRDAAALTLLAELLGGGQTSVLSRELQFDQKLAVFAGAFYSGTSYDDTRFGFVVAPVPGVSLQAAEDALDASLARFVETGVDPAQLERVKFQLRAARIYEQDDVESLANRYGAALASGLTLQDVAEWPDILQSVTAEDVVAAARTLLRPEASVTGWLTAAETAAAEAPAPVPAPEVTQ
jgi:zinc protease